MWNTHHLFRLRCSPERLNGLTLFDVRCTPRPTRFSPSSLLQVIPPPPHAFFRSRNYYELVFWLL